MASIAGLQDLRKQGAPADIGNYVFPATAIVFRFNFSGSTYVCAIVAGDGGWNLIAYSPAGADQVEINAALTFVNSLGRGNVIVLAGIYMLSGAVVIPGNNIDLGGVGNNETVFQLQPGVVDNCITAIGRSNIEIHDLKVFPDKTNNPRQGLPGTAAELLQNGISVQSGDTVFIHNVYALDSGWNGIQSYQSTDIIVSNCISENPDWHGIQFWDTCTYFIAESNLTIGSPNQAGLCAETSGTSYGLISNNISRRDKYGINISHSAARITVVGNVLIGNVNHITVIEGPDEIVISSNILYNTGYSSVMIYGSVTATKILICDNYIYGRGGTDSTRHGIQFAAGTYLIICNNYIENNDDGISLAANIDWCLIEGNYIYNNDGNGILLAGNDHFVISDNFIYLNGEHGINLVASVFGTIQGNTVHDNGQRTAGTYHGIRISTTSADITISNNYCSSPGDSQEDGIRLESGPSAILIVGNFCIEGMGSGIALADDNDAVFITCNYLINNDDYGVEITTANAQNNWVINNYYFGNGIAPILDNGTNTRLATRSMPFIQGTTLISAAGNPWGWEIDEDGEFALTFGWLPLEAQQVVRVRVIAVGLAAPGAGNAMRLELTGEGATFDEAYTAHSIDVANKNSQETNFAVNDVIQWIFTAADDADIGALLGGDRVQFKVLHEAAGNGDIATDAVFSSVEVEYV